MEAGGWELNVSRYAFPGQKIADQETRTNLGFVGWRDLNDQGSITATMKGSGKIKLDLLEACFGGPWQSSCVGSGNCNLKVYKNGAETGTLTCGESKEVQLNYVDGDKIKIAEMFGIISLKGVQIECEASSMVRDSSYDGKKCFKYGSERRVFDLRGGEATEDKCSAKCQDTSSCVAYSGIFNSWCIGCDTTLQRNHRGSKAYKKPTVKKQMTTTRCACENPGHRTFMDCTQSRTCACNGRVRLGHGSRWSAWKDVMGSIQCTHGAFGGDPASGQAKECVCESSAS